VLTIRRPPTDNFHRELIYIERMRAILQKRALRFVLLANVISMLGSGMNSAAVAWQILQATHSEMALGTLAVLQTLPAMLLLPFTGVIIDREDRRRLVMMLDAARAIIIFTVSILAFRGKVHIWQLYLMNTLVAAGFWMFWPTITALIQELTPEGQFVEANTFLLAGIQGGWLMAGAIVGFVYNHIGLGGVLLIDFLTYVVSFLCYLLVRKGRHVVPRPAELRADIVAAETAEKRFWHELWEGIEFLRLRPSVVLLGLSWALFLGAMLTGVVVTPSLSDRIFHAGAVGYGWLNGGWGIGAFLSALYAPKLIARLGSRGSIALSMGLLAACMTLSPHTRLLAIAVAFYGIMGSARGISGVAMNTSLMEQVPQHFMGRVQNAFYFVGTFLQIALGLTVGWMAQKVSLAGGFALIGSVYVIAFLSAAWPMSEAKSKLTESASSAVETVR
jgi:MFS transporter, DHA3 family, macrolide efflux protein